MSEPHSSPQPRIPENTPLSGKVGETDGANAAYKHTDNPEMTNHAASAAHASIATDCATQPNTNHSENPAPAEPISPETYRQELLDTFALSPLAIEHVALSEALGRICAQDIYARFPVPPFTNSAMDGYAVCSEQFRGGGPWDCQVDGDRAAGSIGSDHLESTDGASGSEESNDSDGSPNPNCPNTGSIPTPAPDTGYPAVELHPSTESSAKGNSPIRVCRIMTGAVLPEWADAVVKVEDTNAPSGPSQAPQQVRIFAPPHAGLNVRRRGESIEIGQLVIPCGQQLNAQRLSALASVGYADVPVRRRPRIAVIATGDELCAPGQELGLGQIPDSNSVQLAGLIRELGGEPLCQRVGDNPNELAEALSIDADLIITSGGVSMGAFDPIKHHGLRHGWQFRKVTMQPGKPQGYGWAGTSGRTPVVCLPGNPVSVLVSFCLFVRPIIDALFARMPTAMDSDSGCQYARAEIGWRSPAGRRQFVPVQLRYSNGIATICPSHVGGSGSHLVTGLAGADALAVVPEECCTVNPGDELRILRISPL
ncbi:gephyrin-like molybdotransferase Glp [Trueperella sp. LYQ141]|uniref:molybdopterin molybdotransferase MoeA n=1 Tax=Trueperella sp. LYQ141 TaxID=3391058 RepID=UPI00398307D9